jgi:hypothetical protein
MQRDGSTLYFRCVPSSLTKILFHAFVICFLEFQSLVLIRLSRTSFVICFLLFGALMFGAFPTVSFSSAVSYKFSTFSINPKP